MGVIPPSMFLSESAAPQPVMVEMPAELDGELLRAVRNDRLTSCANREQMNIRIGWLVCAWEVLVKEQLKRRLGQPL